MDVPRDAKDVVCVATVVLSVPIAVLIVPIAVVAELAIDVVDVREVERDPSAARARVVSAAVAAEAALATVDTDEIEALAVAIDVFNAAEFVLTREPRVARDVVCVLTVDPREAIDVLIVPTATLAALAIPETEVIDVFAAAMEVFNAAEFAVTTELVDVSDVLNALAEATTAASEPPSATRPVVLPNNNSRDVPDKVIPGATTVAVARPVRPKAVEI